MLGDERAELGREHREDLADLGRAHAGLVVLEQHVVGVVVGCEALDVLAAELHGALEPRPERREVGLLAGLHPHLVGVRSRLDEPRREICRDATGAVKVAQPHADQRSVVGVVRERVGVRPELLVELAEPIVRLEIVGDLLDRAELRRARWCPARWHEHRHVPDEHRARAADVRQLPEPFLELRERRFHGRGLYRRVYGRSTGYTRAVADESPELFDDIYLGLRAGGAARKQRRGEPLSVEEEEAIGRWQRLSLWRRFIAIGAFALGTFGLGFTVGGLIFGRWRTARR